MKNDQFRERSLVPGQGAGHIHQQPLNKRPSVVEIRLQKTFHLGHTAVPNKHVKSVNG
jgi:hypothetical protein